jgi:acyl-coenzyme A thioesterase PaaI-like protein
MGSSDPTRFNGALGRMIVQPAGPNRGRVRILPEHGQSNLGDAVHGGAILSLIDVALFAGGHMAGMSDTDAVTLDLQTHFIAAGRLGVPLDAEVELLRETGRLVFLRGTVVQGEETVAAFGGTLRKIRPR